jgi:antitoxin YefM
MLVISSREFRDNQKKYLDLVDKQKQIVVRRGKDKAYLLTPISEIDRMSVNPELIRIAQEAEQEFKEGKTIRIQDPKNIWDSIR